MRELYAGVYKVNHKLLSQDLEVGNDTVESMNNLSIKVNDQSSSPIAWETTETGTSPTRTSTTE